MMILQLRLPVVWLLLAVFQFSNQYYVIASIPCNNSDICQKTLLSGSECLPTGFCSNAYYKGGCLANHKLNINQNNNNNMTTKNIIRVCTSADPPEAETLGYCIPNEHWNYTEIRLMGNNWESIFFETWIVQILLSEILGVPTTVDTGMADTVVDFYNYEGRMEYGKGYDWDAIRMATQVQDCRSIQQADNAEDYKSCAHVSLEVWNGQMENMRLLHEEHVAEKPTAMGVLGNGGWYIPKFTAEYDPTLMTHFGLAGENNRRKLAETFLRPTSWIDYCNEVSTTNCSQPDDVAQRGPDVVEEESMMFLKGVYTGYFRKTIENDCDTYPQNCTGNIVDYPCGWSSFIQPHHLTIALQSSGDEPICHGYKYDQMVQIWHAANATKSHVMMLYWTPDSLVQTYAGTDAEFQKVTLPQPTQECFDHRVNTLDRCEPNLQKRIGHPLGVCDDPSQTLMKIVSTALYEISHNPNIPDALRSPAYETIQNFEMSVLQIGDVFNKWLQSDTTVDRIIEPREAACQWVVENYDLVQSFIPRTYPRVMENGENTLQDPMFYVSLILGIAVLVFIFIISAAVYKFRERRVMALAQPEFLFCLLGGLMLVQFGSFAMLLSPSNVSCTFAVWAVNLGYTLELVPLIVKIAAINTLMAAARRMKRIKINRSNLFLVVAFFTSIMTIFLIIWTVIDPPEKRNHYELTNGINDDNDTIVMVYSACHTNQPIWTLLTLFWRCGLLLCATVLAVQTRKSPINFNESRILAILIYSQFLFLVWTLILFFVSKNYSNMARYASLIQSIDVASACCIYFLPKIFTTDADFHANNQQQRTSVHFGSQTGSMIQSQVRGSMFNGLDSSTADPISSNQTSTTPQIEIETDMTKVIADSRMGHAGSTCSDRCSTGSDSTEKTGSQNIRPPPTDKSAFKDAENQYRTTGMTTTNDFPVLSDFKVFDSYVVGTVIYKNEDGQLNEVIVKSYSNDGNDESKIRETTLQTPLILQQLNDIVAPIEENQQFKLDIPGIVIPEQPNMNEMSSSLAR
jgi:7 transmembrane sweet-taste receptor of 3 GCPR